MSTTFPAARAYRLADALDAAPNADYDDYAEAAYLRSRFGFRTDCCTGGSIGCTRDDFSAADRYLDCVQVRLDRAERS